MKIVDIANEIYTDMGSPTTTSIPTIAFWVRGQIGRINTLLFESFMFNETTQEIVFPDGSEISYEAVAVIKQMYKIYELEITIRQNMLAIAANPILKIDDQGTSITRINRNTVNLTFAAMRRDEFAQLDNLVKSYHSKTNRPLQVIGDDTEVGLTQQWPGHYPVYLRR